jgi:hypothetical protein
MGIEQSHAGIGIRVRFSNRHCGIIDEHPQVWTAELGVGLGGRIVCDSVISTTIFNSYFAPLLTTSSIGECRLTIEVKLHGHNICSSQEIFLWEKKEALLPIAAIAVQEVWKDTRNPAVVAIARDCIEYFFFSQSIAHRGV